MLNIDIDKCLAKKMKSDNPETHCWLDICEGWGCRYICSMGTWQNCLMGDYWYTHGKFNRLRTIFYFDKAEIKDILLKEVYAKGVDKCPAFSIDHLNDLIDKLPDKAYIDGKKWTYYDKCETKLINGKPKKVITTSVTPLFDELFNFTDIDDNTMIRNPKKEA